jgi:dihydroorotate dehydrogenase (NAD+) catalytic subunit
MTASGTAGYGTELAPYFDLSALGAVVVKSLSSEPWLGNPAPRVHETDAGMLNSVGLQNPGVDSWVASELPALVATGARVVASIWGHSVGDFAKAASALAGASGVVAVEVNLSCPNLDSGRHIFAASPSDAAAAVDVSRACGLPLWAKLSPAVPDIASIAGAVLEAGADALTLVNTVPGMAIDVDTAGFRLGAGSGGLSGPAIRPVAVRCVYECRRAFPRAAIVGVGGVVRGEDAVELLMAGANAVQVGTATFANPRAPLNVLEELSGWCARHDVATLTDLVGRVHGTT